MLALVLGFRSCQGALTDTIVARIPPSTDQSVGHAFAEMQRQSHRLDAPVDPAVAARIERAFNDVVAALTPAERAALPGLRVTCVRDDTPNAFALPGGEVFVLTGLVDRAGDDLALRGVLAHELGHAVRRHGMRRLVGDQFVTIAATVLLGDIAGVSGTMVALASGLEGLRYGRSMEDEADAFGATLLARRGDSVEGLARFLESLGTQPVPSVLSTHPDPVERARLLRARR
jgi:predicted Zn-dependent protease